MKVKCIDNGTKLDNLTVGKVYDVIDVENALNANYFCYLIKCDNGQNGFRKQFLFETVVDK